MELAPGHPHAADRLSTDALFLLERLDPMPLDALEAAADALIDAVRARYARPRRWHAPVRPGRDRPMTSLFALAGGRDLRRRRLPRRHREAASTLAAVTATQGAGLLVLLLFTPLMLDGR